MTTLTDPISKDITTALRLRVVHETEYRYQQPVEMAHHVACLRPRNDAGQRLRLFDMSVTPEPGQHSLQQDAFGNSRAYFALSSPHDRLLVVARSEVTMTPRYETLNPMETATVAQTIEHLTYRAHAPFQAASEFVAPSPFVPLHAELRAYAAESLRPGRPVADAASELMQRIHRDFRYAPSTTDISTPILDVFDKRRGVCQDFAHFMLGCLRVSGLAARYVSGYLLTTPLPGQEKLVGSDASHAWVSVWCPLADGSDPACGAWLDLDPTNDCVADLHHVRVAYGRDFGDVTPLRGVIRGGGDHTLEVRVTTEPMSADLR